MQENKIIHKKIENAKNPNLAYTELRERICESKGISIRDFEKRYTVDSAKTIVKFSDKPWSDLDELRSDIEDLSSIRKVHYIPPTVGVYGPPVFCVETSEPVDEIRDEVNAYYDGLNVEASKYGVLVFISPDKRQITRKRRT